MAVEPGRDLDALVAEHFLGWVWDDVAPDYDGTNKGRVLRPPCLPASFEYPPKGKIHPAFHCARWSTDIRDAMQLWDKIPRGVQHHGEGATLPLAICRAALQTTIE